MICPYSLSRPGGAQGQAVGLSRALGARGHQVLLLAPDDEHPVGATRPLEGVAAPTAPGGPSVGVQGIGRSTALRANGSRVPLALDPVAAGRALRASRSFRPDVVHLHEPMAPFAGYGCLLSPPAPLVGTYHRSGPSGWYRALGPVARWANGRLAARCAVSEAACETARTAMGGSYRVLFNGLELDRFTGADPWPTRARTVLFVGRHEPRKGLAVLLEAFEAVDPSAVLWVAGHGPETARLRRRYPPSGRVEWLGAIDDAELAMRLSGADVLCAPSLGGESFGVVLLEGMAAGCAVVASDLPGYRSCADDHADLVAPGDVAALRAALAAALTGADGGTGRSAPDARSAARAHAEEWSMGRLAARYEEIYREVAGGRSGGAGGGDGHPGGVGVGGAGGADPARPGGGREGPGGGGSVAGA